MKIDNAVFIIGIPDDKDYIGVVKNIEPKSSSIILTKSENPHYIFTSNQQTELYKQGIETLWTESVSKALVLAREKKKPIVILGTTSVIADVKKIIKERD